MSSRTRIALVRATGLIGRHVLASSVGCGDIRVLALARRHTPMPDGAPAELVVADPERWGEAFAAFRPHTLICALGTTWRKAGADAAAFRAVDHGLVIDNAAAAKAHGAARAVLVSSVGAVLSSRSFYLRTKAEIERDMAALGFERLDILRPGLLHGERGADRRLKERAAIALSPLTDAMLHGSFRRFRSVAAEKVARAALVLSCRTTPGVFIHHNDDIRQAARSAPASAGV